jgi:hypothetical protein
MGLCGSRTNQNGSLPSEYGAVWVSRTGLHAVEMITTTFRTLIEFTDTMSRSVLDQEPPGLKSEVLSLARAYCGLTWATTARVRRTVPNFLSARLQSHFQKPITAVVIEPNNAG